MEDSFPFFTEDRNKNILAFEELQKKIIEKNEDEKQDPAWKWAIRYVQLTNTKKRLFHVFFLKNMHRWAILKYLFDGNSPDYSFVPT